MGTCPEEVRRNVLNSPKPQAQGVQGCGVTSSEESPSFAERSGSIAHDLNNMLGSMLGYCFLLLEDMSPEDQKRAFLEEVLKAGAEAAQLVAKLLDDARREVGCPAQNGVSEAA
jgi:hypothetical protein